MAKWFNGIPFLGKKNKKTEEFSPLQWEKIKTIIIN
jgi:hypothetical protein